MGLMGESGPPGPPGQLVVIDRAAIRSRSVDRACCGPRVPRCVKDDNDAREQIRAPGGSQGTLHRFTVLA